MGSRANYGLVYGDACEAWCYTRDWSRGNLPVRRCSRLADGYDPVHGAWLCAYHQWKEDPCLTRQDAVRRRRRVEAEIRQRNRRMKGRGGT